MRGVMSQYAAPIALLFLTNPIGFSQDFSGKELRNAPFAGLNPVSVSVSVTASDVMLDKQYGLSKGIQTDAELKLRQSRVAVQAPEHPTGGSCLMLGKLAPDCANVRIQVLVASRHDLGGRLLGYSYDVEVGVFRDVTIMGVQAPLNALVWRAGGLYTAAPDHVVDIRRTVMDRFDEFLNEYLAATDK